MFDFDDLEDTDPVPDEEQLAKENAAAIELAVADLNHELFTARRDACKKLAALGPAAASQADALTTLVGKEEDYEVQKAAIAALKAMRDGGVRSLQALSIHFEPGVRKLASNALKDLETSGVHIPAAEAPKPAPVKMNFAAIQLAVSNLNHEVFTVRRDACKKLATLGPAAANHADAITELVDREDDYEVQKAAVATLKAMRDAGVRSLQILSIHCEPGVRKLAVNALEELEISGVHIPEAEVSRANPLNSQRIKVKGEVSRLGPTNLQRGKAQGEVSRPRPSNSLRGQEEGEVSMPKPTTFQRDKAEDEVPMPKPIDSQRDKDECEVPKPRPKPKPANAKRDKDKQTCIKKRRVRREGTDPKEGSNQDRDSGRPPCSADVPTLPDDYRGPYAQFRVFKELLPMCLATHRMTPHEIISIWENEWRVPYASRIKFVAPEDSDQKFLHPHDDVVPGAPFEVELHAGAGVILDGLAVALRRYGCMDKEEFLRTRNLQEQKKASAAEVRKKDDARQLDRWAMLEEERQLRFQTPEDAERRRLLKIKDKTPWKLQEEEQRGLQAASSSISPVAPYS